MNIISDLYKLVMAANWNPLRKIPDIGLRHLLMQLLAWMWSIIFSLYFGSWLVFGLTASAHFLLIFGVFMTAIIFNKGGKYGSNNKNL